MLEVEIEDHVRLVYAIARGVARSLAPSARSVADIDDLASAGFLGLLDAAEKFDPATGTKFSTYAAPRIRGAILDSIRALDWAPRLVRSNQRKVNTTRAEFVLEARRDPTKRELADALGWSTQYLDAQMVLFAQSVDSGDQVVSQDGRDVATFDLVAATTPGPLELIENDEAYEMLYAAIEDLPTQARYVVNAYYFDGLTQAEIGTLLGVTESRVCQILKRAIATLRARQDTKDFFPVL